jgi:hypothetical protein
MLKRGLLVGVLVGSSALLVAACTLITNFDKYKSGGVEKPDVLVPDAPPPADTGPTCSPALIPENTATGEGDGTGRIVFAMSSMQVGLRSAASADAGTDGGDTSRALGYDLDLKCTCPGAGTCTTPDIALSSLKGGVCDFENGIDNSGGKVVNELLKLFAASGDPTAPGQLDPQVPITNGKSSILFVVANYNGTDDDKSVQVAVASASGVDNSTQKRPGEANLFLPDFDGQDSWSFDGTSVTSKSPMPAGAYAFNSAANATGHVVGGVLVVPNLPNLTARVGQLALRLERSVLTAKIVKVGAAYRLESGVIAGRVTNSNFLGALAGVKSPSGPFCSASDAGGGYAAAKDIVCSSLDLTIDGAGNGTEPCDALSFAFGFSALPARLGKAIDLPLPPNLCGNVATDACSR